MNKSTLICLLLLVSSPAYCFRPFILHTGKNQVKVIEFYTSEACEKCEGPEKWLGNLRSDKGLFKKFIAVSFHLPEVAPKESPVGTPGGTPANLTLKAPSGTPTSTPYPTWVDIFSKPEFTSRKKDPNNIPSFVVNGENWQWDENSKFPAIDKVEDVGDLSVARNRLKEFEITFSPKEKLDNVDINVALLGNGITRKVTRGENDIRTLNENFVVLEFVTKNLHKTGNVFSGHVKLNLAKNSNVQTFSAVFWTTKVDDLKPLQATGGDLKLE